MIAWCNQPASPAPLGDFAPSMKQIDAANHARYGAPILIPTHQVRRIRLFPRARWRRSLARWGESPLDHAPSNAHFATDSRQIATFARHLAPVQLLRTARIARSERAERMQCPCRRRCPSASEGHSANTGDRGGGRRRSRWPLWRWSAGGGRCGLRFTQRSAWHAGGSCCASGGGARRQREPAVAGYTDALRVATLTAFDGRGYGFVASVQRPRTKSDSIARGDIANVEINSDRGDFSAKHFFTKPLRSIRIRMRSHTDRTVLSISHTLCLLHIEHALTHAARCRNSSDNRQLCANKVR